MRMEIMCIVPFSGWEQIHGEVPGNARPLCHSFGLSALQQHLCFLMKCHIGFPTIKTALRSRFHFQPACLGGLLPIYKYKPAKSHPLHTQAAAWRITSVVLSHTTGVRVWIPVSYKWPITREDTLFTCAPLCWVTAPMGSGFRTAVSMSHKRNLTPSDLTWHQKTDRLYLICCDNCIPLAMRLPPCGLNCPKLKRPSCCRPLLSALSLLWV